MHIVTELPPTGLFPSLTTRLLLRPDEGAAMLGLSRAAIYRLMAEGRIQSIKVGRSRRIPTQEIERFVAEEVDAQCA